jgi:endonuclease YncB( thermonuclease family)
MSARAGMTKVSRPRPLLTALLLALLLAALAARADVPARVVAVHDGDTVTVLSHRRELRIRLTDIDAPELGQPFGKRSKTALSDVCFGTVAGLEIRGRDRYGRTLARLRCDGVDANAEQVRRGYAWVFTRYARANSPLYALQLDAQAARRGLWTDGAPTPPWKWRRQRRTAARSVGSSDSSR